MKNKLNISKNSILRIIIICTILYFVIDIIFYVFNFITFLVRDIESVKYYLHGLNFSYMVNYLDAVNVKSYKGYLYFSYLSKIPFFVLKCFIAYSFIKLLSKYETSLFIKEISDKVIKIYYASLIFFCLRYIYLSIDSVIFHKVFASSERISYYFNTNELFICLVFIIFMIFYFLAKNEKIKVMEVKSKNDIFSRVINFLKEKL